MRKLIAVTMTLALVCGIYAVPASAVTSTDVVNSGNNLDVNATSKTNTDVSVVNMNNATITQINHQSANTGNVQANGNIAMPNPCNPCAPLGSGVAVQTGNATTTSNQTASGINQNATAVEVPAGSQAQNNTSVVNSAGNADITTKDKVNTDVHIFNDNNAYVSQVTDQNTNSGFVKANDNIGGTSVVTGIANAISTQTVKDVNNNTNAVAITGHPTSTAGLETCNECVIPCTGGNCTSIMNTGNKLNVKTETETNIEVGVMNFNSLFSMQMLDQDSNSGFVQANDNIYGTDVSTGAAGATAGQSLSGNQNANGVAITDLGMPMGENLLTVLNSGKDVETKTEAEVNTDVHAMNMNKTMGFQMTWSESNSGFVVTNHNIGSGTSGTGNAGTDSAQGLSGNTSTNLIGGSMTTLMALMSALLL